MSKITKVIKMKNNNKENNRKEEEKKVAEELFKQTRLYGS